MERLRILLNQMVSEKTVDVFLNEIRHRPPVLLVKLVQERESLNSLLNQIGISPGLDRVGVITALEIWSKEYEQGPLAIEKEEKQRSMAIIEKEEEQGPLAIEKEEEQGSMAIIEKEEEKSLGTDEKPVDKWTTDEVVYWAEKIVDFEELSKLKTNKVNGNALLNSSVEELRNIGITYGPAKNLIEGIKKLKGPTQESPIDWTVEPLKKFQPPTSIRRSNWPILQRGELEDVWRKIEESRPARIAIIGRRQIGKTFLAHQVSARCYGNKLPFLFVEAYNNLPEFFEELKRVLKHLDTSLADRIVPSSNNLVRFLCWLLRCGVFVIIDEFQRLNKVPGAMETFQSELDSSSIQHSGAFIILGSHISKLQWLVQDEASPLWLRIQTIINLPPLGPSTLFNYLHSNFNISSSNFFKLYSFFGGIFGLYYDLYVSTRLESEKLDKLDGFEYIRNKFFLSGFDQPYLDTLQATCSSILGLVAYYRRLNMSSRDTEKEIASKLALSPSTVHFYIMNLVCYNFVVEEKPIFPLKKKYSRYFIQDAPLLAINKLQESGDATTAKNHLEGLVLEQFTREMIKINGTNLFEGASLSLIVFQNFYWIDTWTEIDVVVQDKPNKKMYWGSCKRNFRYQSLENSVAHLYSFYMQRFDTQKKWTTYEHVFFFVSPEVDEDHLQNNLIGHYALVLDKINNNDFGWLDTNASRQLTKGREKPNDQWLPGTNHPIQMLKVSNIFYVFSVLDLLLGKSRKYF